MAPVAIIFPFILLVTIIITKFPFCKFGWVGFCRVVRIYRKTFRQEQFSLRKKRFISKVINMTLYCDGRVPLVHT